jgi:hypothetical protein
MLGSKCGVAKTLATGSRLVTRIREPYGDGACARLFLSRWPRNGLAKALPESAATAMGASDGDGSKLRNLHFVLQSA